MKAHIIKNNFSAGELSPLLSTRTELSQYQNGARTLTNVIPLVEGGIKKRPGTFYRDAYSPDTALRLIPFVVSADNAFLLIVGLNIIHIFNPATGTTITTVATPYFTAQNIKELQFVHTRYSMYFTSGDHPVQWLRCSEDFTTWVFSPFVFDVPPVDELVDTPNAALESSGKDVAQIVVLQASDYPAWASAVSYFIGDRVTHATKIWQANVDNVNKQPDTSPTEWTEITGSATDVFTPAHIGSLIFINGGIVRITAYINPTRVGGEVLVALSSTAQAIAKSWTLKSPVFSASRGYPKCCAYFKQRLVLANSKAYPNMIWFSRIGDTRNFLPTINDADSFSVASSSDQADNILHLAQSRGVIALTGGAEFLITSDGPLTPTTVEISEHTSYGAFANVRPTRIGNELLFVQRGGERLRAMSYRYEVDGLVSPELSAVASHIGETHQGIIETTYQQEPESLVWCVLGDGKVASITLNREQEVVAWAQHDFGGAVQSMCSIQTSLGSDLCYALILRNGFHVLEQLSFGALTDCQTMQPVVDGVATTGMGDFLDANNIVGYYALGDECYRIPFLGKEPGLLRFDTDEDMTIGVGNNIKCVCVLNPPELAGVPATALDKKATVHYVYLYLHKTLGAEFNDKLLSSQSFGDDVISPSKVFTGRIIHGEGGWNDLYSMKLQITHNQPLPFHLQAISIVLSINEK